MNSYNRNAIIFKAFCDESRLRIIDLIKQGETCSCVLLEDLTITQPTLSHHMKILIESGVVTFQKDGKYTMYSLSADGIREAISLLEEIRKVHESNANNKCRINEDICVNGQ